MRGLMIACCALLWSCTVGPDFHAPPAPAMPHFNDAALRPNPAVSEASDPDPLWWNAFNDKILTGLMNQAIANNPSLREAVLRVVVAHENVTTAAAAGLPTLSGNASYMREQLGVKGLLEEKGAYSGIDQLGNAANQYASGTGAGLENAGTNLLNGIGAPINLYQYGLSSSWELDLFGRVRRSVEEAKASAQAQREAANDALVMLESQVAQAYFALRGAQALAQQQVENVRVAQDSLNLTLDRARRGLDPQLNVEQAQSQLDTEQAQAENYEKQAEQSIDQINVLVGQAPGTLDALLSAPAPLPAVPQVVGIGLPSTLARRRPDVREAEAQLHAATASVGVAVANFYPDISLMGSAGIRATDTSFLTNWANLFYSAGPTVTLPIFEGGTLVANLRTARAQQASAALNYRATVLNALAEVEDALVAYRTDRIARDASANSLQAADLSYYLSNNRYENGLSSFLQVLDAERTLVAAREQLAQANEQLADDVATLFTALGGGWTETAAQVPDQTVPARPPPLPAAIDGLAD